jgi:hypothetical protein
MTNKQALAAITSAIMTANIEDPVAPDGTTWDQHVMDKAKAEHLAKAALRGLRKAGFVVMKRGIMGA